MSSPVGNKNESQSSDETGPQFTIQKIYAKDISFETPHSPAVFTEDWHPNINLNLSSAAQSLTDHAYEVALTVTVTVKTGEKTAFLVEVHQAGIFSIQGFGQEELGHMLGSYCPNILFPYAREAVTDLVVRGGFPQLVLAPVNFEALYAQRLDQEGAEHSRSPQH